MPGVVVIELDQAAIGKVSAGEWCRMNQSRDEMSEQVSRIYRLFVTHVSLVPLKSDVEVYRYVLAGVTPDLESKRTLSPVQNLLFLSGNPRHTAAHLVGVPNWAETVNSGSVEPDQARTCEGKQE